MNKIILILILLPSLALSQWVKQNPLTPVKNLYSASFIDINTGWAVGDTGTIIKTTNGGLNWEYHNLVDRIYLFGVKFISSSTGYIAADSGRVYKTTDGGNSWVYYSTGTNSRLLCISFPDINTGYCAGWYYILKTTNAGVNWLITNPNLQTLFYSIFFINPLRGWACGGNTLFKTTNGGLTWDTAYPSGLDRPPEDVFFVDANTGWVTQNQSSAVAKTTDGGYNFVLQYNGPGNMMNSLYFINSSTGWAAGDNIIKTTNGGNNWSAQIPYYWAFSTILFPSSMIGYALGSTGSIAKTEDGNNWENISIDISDGLYKILAMNGNLVLAVGENGTIAKTTNGGMNWIRKQSNVLEELYDLCFINNSTGWISGYDGIILRTSDAGENWSIQNTGYTRPLRSVSFADANTGFVAGDSIPFLKTTNSGTNWLSLNYGGDKRINKILALDANKIFAVGYYGAFLRSSNGGISWTIIDPDSTKYYYDIYFINSMTGWVIKNFPNNLLKSTNGGINWFNLVNNLPMPYAHSLIFFNEFTGWILYPGTTFRTTNGGLYWDYSSLPGFSAYTDMDFSDANTGWIVGDMGYIYKTTNGGLIGIENNHESVPTAYKLFQNYPNPFNPSTKIKFDIPNFPLMKGVRGMNVRLTIYDLLGREVATLINQPLQPGTYEANWDGTNYPSGVYFYKLTTPGFTESRKMVLVK